MLRAAIAVMTRRSDTGRRANGLREEADPELLDLPADLGRGLARPGLGWQRGERVVVGVLYPVDDGHLLRVPAGVLGELVQAAADRLHVAGEGGQPGGARRGEEAGVDEAVELAADVGGGRARATGLRSPSRRSRASWAPRRISSAQVTTS